ncbi:uncharacterized protein LOC134206329 [Armigeres subalbatus]|uniref:uncharacterized protein LOC134206329 n=1 Tax=Armigeres subalbatus TaxID=124917 RepID=UPI002ED082BA
MRLSWGTVSKFCFDSCLLSELDRSYGLILVGLADSKTEILELYHLQVTVLSHFVEEQLILKKPMIHCPPLNQYPVPMEKKIIYESFQWFNKYVATNHEQLSAVRNIVNRTSFPVPYILFGPPGTGKTSTIVEAVLQIWKLQPKANVLVSAASNFACDEFTTRLLEFIPVTDVFRFVYFVSILLITEQHHRSQRAVEVLRKVVSIVAAPTTNIRKAVHHTRKIHRTAMVEDRSAAVEDSVDVVVSVAVFIVIFSSFVNQESIDLAPVHRGDAVRLILICLLVGMACYRMQERYQKWHGNLPQSGKGR